GLQRPKQSLAADYFSPACARPDLSGRPLRGDVRDEVDEVGIKRSKQRSAARPGAPPRLQASLAFAKSSSDLAKHDLVDSLIPHPARLDLRDLGRGRDERRGDAVPRSGCA